MPPPLPDVDSQSYQDYQADQFGAQTERRIGALGFSTAADARIASLNDVYAPPPMPAPEPQPAPDLPNPPEGQPAPPASETAPETISGMSPTAPVTADFQSYSGSRAASPDQGVSSSPSGANQAATAGAATSPDLVAKALNAADSVGLDPHLFVSLIQQESGFDPNARSPVGAQGLSQLMPDTARGLGVTDPYDIDQNLTAGAKYLRQNLDRFGGDVVKALAAYNAGPGAVEKFNGVPPYEETQKYVDSIMGRLSAEQTQNPAGGVAPGPTEALPRVGADIAAAPVNQRDISQFGDPQLTSDEAYAACGPAAAVRFAQRFGRNPTLREATDLAKTVGWTSQQGMAGLSSEKSLMDILNVPTKLVQGAQWDVFAKEAATGNPVTISTVGHYFTADGYNPDSGAFHVGKSGLDLKGGAEWMTPQQMQNLMGAVQGGLLADNPQVPTPSTADQDTNPGGWLDRTKTAFSSAWNTATSAVDATVKRVQSPDTGNPIGDVAGTAASALGTGVQSALSPFSGASEQFPTGGPLAGPLVGGIREGLGQEQIGREGGDALRQQLSDLLARKDAGEQGLDTQIQQVSDQYNALFRGDSVYSAAQRNPQIGLGEGLAGLSQAAIATPLATEGAPLAAKAAAAVIDPQTGLPAVAGRAIEAAGPVLRSREAAGGMPFVRGPATPAYQSVMPGGTFEPATPAGSAGLGDKIEALRTAAVRGIFDRQVDINQIQQAYAKALGRPLNADEMAAELQRLSADPAAQVKIDEGLKPAIQSVGDDYNALRDYVTLRSNVQVAEGLGNEARTFSGGMTAANSKQAMTEMESQLGPERFAQVQQAADQVSQFSNQTRQRLVDSGVLSQEQADQMAAKYPDWAKTRILDYMADPAGGQGAGTKIGLADRQLRQYTLEGTDKAREDPLASTVAYTHQVERMANKNDAFNAMLKIDQASPNPMLRQVPQDFSPTKGQVTMIGFVDGQKVKYVTNNKALGEAINGAGVMSVPEWTSAWQKVFRSLATSRNPVFLAGNAALDIPTYTFRTAIRDGGPQALPGIMADLARGYADAFQGLLQGEYRGSGTSAFLKGGGGQSGYFTGGEGQAAQTIADLRRSNVFEINSKADLLRLTKDLLTLKPVEALGERIELGPRVAAYNRALQRGANPVQAVIDGRTVTVDFSQGGTVTKYLNNFVPFWNVGFQGPVQIARAWRDNPRAFVATAGTLIGLPAVAAEVWNRSDPQRAKDYADIPDYVKNQGIVVMLPGNAPADAQGNRKPLYAVLKLREWAPIAAIAREATARALGDDSKSLAEMAQSAGTGLSPLQASSVGSLGSEALSGIPVVPAALQLEQNRDFFRSRDIVTNRADQNASAAAKQLTPMIQAAVDKLGLNAEVRPSAVDFFIRNQGAGVGGAALGASDLAAGKARQDTSPTSLPGVGGLIGRFVGSQTGQGMQTARTEELTPSARQILRSNGITSTPGPATGSVNQIPLKLDEETRYQQLTNRYVDEAIHRVVQTPEWATMTQQGKNLVMQRAIGAARTRAGTETLSSIPEAERMRRLQTKSTAPTAPAGVGATP